MIEQPTIYEQVPSGYAKGSDTVAYVQRILDRFHRYQRETAGQPAIDAHALSSSDNSAVNG